MPEGNQDILEQIVTILVTNGVENFLVVAENPESQQQVGEDFRAVFGGKKSRIVAMLMRVLQQKEDNLALILDSFVSLGHLDKTEEEGEVDKVIERLRKN
ncbi:MAG: hypothetical protein PVF76_13730 [Syntrophobacterales bacterium]|jgi:hypothetical protein